MSASWEYEEAGPPSSKDWDRIGEGKTRQSECGAHGWRAIGCLVPPFSDLVLAWRLGGCLLKISDSKFARLAARWCAMNHEAPRILIIRLSALGDILHSLPVLGALRGAMPGAFIGWVVEDGGAPLVMDHPMLDAVHVVPRRAMKKDRWGTLRGPFTRLVREVRSRRYDTALDLQGLSKSAIWTVLSGARRRIGFGGPDAREISPAFYNHRVRCSDDPADPGFHVIRRNLSLLSPLGINRAEVSTPVHLPEAALRRANEIWGDADGNTDGEGGRRDAGMRREPERIIINLGAGWVTKQWPAERFGLLGRRLAQERGARVAFAWGPGDRDLLQRALESAGASHELPQSVAMAPGVQALPPTTFMELGAVIGRARLYIGGDTGPTHFAAALGVPTLGIYGASDPRRNGPWGVRSRSIQIDPQSGGPPCIPCWKTRCRWHEPLACLNGLAESRVWEICVTMLEDFRPPEAAS